MMETDRGHFLRSSDGHAERTCLFAALCPGHDAEELTVRPKLLIVEDDAAMREVWETVFGSRGWEVVVTSSVAEGLSSLDPPPDFLILDLRLPDGGGETILRRVREAGLRTRVVVTTGTDDATVLSEVRSLRPEAMFAKPIKVADVWREALAA
jgi:DNA-binding response OmpR family regulator